MNAVLKLDIQDSFEVFQSMAHKQLDESLEKLRPLFEQDKPPTLLEISSALQEIKHELSGALLQEAAHSLNQQQRDQEFFPCPHCGRLVKKRDASRKIETRHGESLLTRPYCYCRHCKESFCPMDEALELSPRKKQFDLQKLALKFLAKMPFEEAAQLFYESTGMSFSDHSLHDFFSSFAEDMSPAKGELGT
ncbi:MAG: hypothetical protein K9K64_12205 [Desulfohalobiaceae bacterium]|nr:hypothetical protein [Desulfohalobiaceae bacterium]